MLCTDGLSEMVDDRSIARILHEHDQPRDGAQALLGEALERGGTDNVTVIVARYEIPTDIAIVAELPRTPSGKPDLGAIRRFFADAVPAAQVHHAE